VIAQSTVTRLFEQIFASGWSCPEITVIWHAGEPLVVPVSFYREAFATIERRVESRREIVALERPRSMSASRPLNASCSSRRSPN
jgi:sulfatase maturation enzyme AslB (radical SAM superfamily)